MSAIDRIGRGAPWTALSRSSPTRWTCAASASVPETIRTWKPGRSTASPRGWIVHSHVAVEPGRIDAGWPGCSGPDDDDGIRLGVVGCDDPGEPLAGRQDKPGLAQPVVANVGQQLDPVRDRRRGHRGSACGVLLPAPPRARVDAPSLNGGRPESGKKDDREDEDGQGECSLGRHSLIVATRTAPERSRQRRRTGDWSRTRSNFPDAR